MKKLTLILLFLLAFSCQKLVNKPKNLISKNEMAILIADLAINDQVSYINPNGNLEAGTRFILKNHNIKGKDFVDSYQYYILDKSIEGIFEDAQQIILDKDPKSEDYIKKTLERTSKEVQQTEKLQ